MHAFLLISQDNNIKPKVDELSSKLNAKILNYPLTKIEDVRELNSLTRLTLTEPTLVVSENIHEATDEALNALLKNLEEPQENLFFVLVSPSIRKVLPTIVSRCQVIKANVERQEVKDVKEIENFLNMTDGEKLAYVDKIKDRKLAIELIENTVLLLHSKLHSDQLKYNNIARHIEGALETLTRLNANGNVNLQLTNFVIQYGNK